MVKIQQIDNFSNIFKLIFFSTLTFKIFLSYFFPLTGDEAYFISTSKIFNFGYYEHPPIIWWLIYLFSFFGKYTFHFFYYRLFSVFVTTFMSILILKLIGKSDIKKGYLISSLFLISPLSLFNFLITNDIPLLFFTFLSALFFYKGIKYDKKIYFMISGVFFGLSFLSKYFAVLYFISIFFYIVFKKDKRLWKNFVFFFIFSIPFIFINIYWNYTHCWINFLYNLLYRRKKDYFNIKNIIIYFLSLAFLLTPYSFYFLIKTKFFFKKLKYNYDFFFFIFFIPLIFLLILSFFRKVGLHWYISFLPFSFLILKEAKIEEILNSIKYGIYFSGILIFLIISLLLSPVEKFKNYKKYPHIIMFLRPYPLCEYLENYKNEYIFATGGYTESAVMSYYCKNNFIVFGSLSHSGREYDISFDFKSIDGKDILIFSLEDIDIEKYKDFFEDIKKEKFIVEGAVFYLLFCKNFNYQIYREKILKKIYEKFYKIPKYLPTKGNFFKEKYGF
ncbi:MAG: glycosyltransferase family 39 protein [Candidatus Omnitrophica bacterium]|nr:glycosyltransferase family 39 protein [Candidatus Omnitrophota bacterium]